MLDKFIKILVSQSMSQPRSLEHVELYGAVYTKEWVANLILDLAGYTPDKKLSALYAIEPAAGEGAIAVRMVERLLDSCNGKFDFSQLAGALTFYEIDDESAGLLASSLMGLVQKFSINLVDAEHLVNSWIRIDNFLLVARSGRKADFVLGNPPYIRLEALDPELLEDYRARFRTMKGRADIYVAFFEAALSMLEEGGCCAFICADRWMTNQYGAELRFLITSLFAVEVVIDMHAADAFETEVDAYPAITIVRRSRQGTVAVASISDYCENSTSIEAVSAIEGVKDGVFDRYSSSGIHIRGYDTWFKGREPWIKTSPERLLLLRRFESRFLPLECSESATRVGIGVATGADEIYITTNSNLVEDSRLLPLALGSDVSEEGYQWSGHFLINPWYNGRLVVLSEYPKLQAFFEANEVDLRGRHVGKKNLVGWYRTIDKVAPDLLRKPKLLIPDIRSRLIPALEESGGYPSHNLYFVTSDLWDLKVLGGLLLSDSIHFFAEAYCMRMRGGYYRFQAQYLRKFRVPHPAELKPADSEGLIEAFLTRNRELASRIAATIYAE